MIESNTPDEDKELMALANKVFPLVYAQVKARIREDIEQGVHDQVNRYFDIPLTVEMVAKLYNKTPWTVYKWKNNGILKFHQPPKGPAFITLQELKEQMKQYAQQRTNKTVLLLS